MDKHLVLSMHHEGMCPKNILDRIGGNLDEIKNLIKSNGLSPNPVRNRFNVPYSVDETYFSQIDNHNKAYILGVLYADGCVYAKSERIHLISKDVDLLEFYKKEIGLTKTIQYTVRDHLPYIAFSNSVVKKQLIRLGCFPQKSFTLKFPSNGQVPKEFIGSFIRGYFDGDGCISGNKQIQVKFISSTDFIEGLISCLKKCGISTCKIALDRAANPFTSYFRICKKSSIVLLREIMYQHDEFSLARKKNRFFVEKLNICNNIKSHASS